MKDNLNAVRFQRYKEEKHKSFCQCKFCLGVETYRKGIESELWKNYLNRVDG